ncbi:putative Late nodulin [Medicago truncatula]|uniref:Putative Late nodulin n=1 Tax=Medicago truncatula TaxID=3880 RepID=A0A396GU99_MEDTR|nr:putative Late nodulin [Medicago truncatula]
MAIILEFIYIVVLFFSPCLLVTDAYNITCNSALDCASNRCILPGMPICVTNKCLCV